MDGWWETLLDATRTEAVLVVTALWVLLIAALSKGHSRESAVSSTLVGLLLSAVVAILSFGRSRHAVFDGAMMLRLDNFALAFHLLFVLGALLTVGMAWDYLRERGWLRRISEFCALLLMACVGGMLLVSATDLLIVFLAIETLSLAQYVLTGYASDRPYPTEAALKYLLLGAMASAFLVYGIAFLYGATGTTNLTALRAMFVQQPTLLAIGLGLLLVGLAFKIALVPFHQWAPDAYDGALTPIAAFMATVPKVAAVGALLRVLSLGFSAEPVKSVWVTALAVIAVLTMTVGNLAALPQRNLKRMLAYSSVAHAGYMLLGVLALNEAGASGLIVYGFAYTLMTVGAFALLQLLERADGVPATLDEVMGLAHRHPALGWVMVIFMAGLTGIPFTAGFWAKLAVFKAALESGYLWLVVVAVLNSVVSAFYYLRAAMAMFAQSPTEQTRSVRWERLGASTVAFCALAVLLLGLLPTGLWQIGLAVALTP
jgi:NADH-quinone oxidoreductase subunit N